MKSDRDILALEFLSRTGWGAALRKGLAGDASTRRYERLSMTNGETAVLMDAPPKTNANTRDFVNIARYLGDIGLSAPRIYGKDHTNGFLLLEDLSDQLFVRVLATTPDLEASLYTSATDTLIALHRAKRPDLSHFSAEIMAEQASLVFETWVQTLAGPVDTKVADRFRAGFQVLLHQSTQGEPVVILRDYHAENLIWLPRRQGVARVGLIDFQDAMLAHPAYDLVSLLRDVRRDVSAKTEQAMIGRYIDQTGQNDDNFRAAYAVLGVQRNLRILAVFARLAHSLGKPYYATLIPRTWAHLMGGLKHPALAPVASLLTDILPEPTQENLHMLARK